MTDATIVHPTVAAAMDHFWSGMPEPDRAATRASLLADQWEPVVRALSGVSWIVAAPEMEDTLGYVTHSPGSLGAGICALVETAAMESASYEVLWQEPGTTDEQGDHVSLCGALYSDINVVHLSLGSDGGRGPGTSSYLVCLQPERS